MIEQGMHIVCGVDSEQVRSILRNHIKRNNWTHEDVKMSLSDGIVSIVAKRPIKIIAEFINEDENGRAYPET